MQQSVNNEKNILFKGNAPFIFRSWFSTTNCHESHHDGFTVSSESVFQQLGQHGVTEWHWKHNDIQCFSHNFTIITPQIIGNWPTLTNWDFDNCIQEHCKVTFASQLPITAGWTAEFVRVCFPEDCRRPIEFLKYDTMPGIQPVIFRSQGLRLS